MKTSYYLLLMILVIGFTLGTQAQITNLKVNGFSSNFSITQGDSLKWEYNLPSGETAIGEIWIDLNGNGIIDPLVDKQIFQTFTQTDGQYNSQGPGDLDSLVNGHIYFALENNGVAPAMYVFRFTNNGAQTIRGTVAPLLTPTYTVSGTVTPPPSISAYNILVQTNGQQNGTGWMALTDVSGNYTINFNASAVGMQWGVQVFDQFPPYVFTPAESTITLTHNYTGVNFTYGQPSASIYGYLKGEDGHIFANVEVRSTPQNGGGQNEKTAMTDGKGFFQFEYTLSDINSSPLWRLDTRNSSDIAPAYFPPEVGSISIHQNDSLHVDLIAYVADDSITGTVTIDGHAPSNHSFNLYASTQDSGQTNTNSDPFTGNFTLHVSKKLYNYNLGIENQSIPSGYGYDRNIPWAHPGDNNITLSVIRIAWLPQTSNSFNSLNSVSFVNSTTGWVAGSNGTVLHTTNAGTTWSSQTTNTFNTINGIFFINSLTGWFVADSGVIKNTVNGGTTWTSQNSTTTNNVNAVQFIDANTGWAACSGGSSVRILKTTNGGTTWTNQPTGSDNLYSLSFVDASTGWAVGSSATIIKTTDGGSTWNSQSALAFNTLSSVHFVDANTGWIVGGSTQILNTTDGGSNWTSSYYCCCDLHSVSFINNTTGWAVGDCNSMFGTTDGGSTWTNQLNNVYANLRAVQFVDAYNGWAVGQNGTILHTTTGGVVTSVRDDRFGELPHSFALMQNYPNPFNPTTTIDYNIASAVYVRLSIFNILGQEVLQLVNQEQRPGKYTATFDASQLAGGVYFYRLQAGVFSETKKLVLIK